MRRLFKTHCRRLGGSAVLAVAVISSLAMATAAQAAGPPLIVETWSSQVFSTSARTEAKINPNGASTGYHVDYITAAAYEANVAASRPPFSGALRSPATNEFNLGGGVNTLTTTQVLFSLTPETAYVARFLVHNAQGTVESTPPLRFVTQASGGEVLLPDSRGWEQVSPIEKNGGAVATPGSLSAGGVYQAAADGQSVTYSSSASFGGGGGGAPPASQYLGKREAGDWSTANLSTPLFSGSFDFTNAGDPFQVFSPDLLRALILNGDHCRGGRGGECAVANAPLPGTDAPNGFQDYYLREIANSSSRALLGDANAGFLSLDPAHFDLTLRGFSPDLGHAVVSSCAALTANATQAALGSGCDPELENLYAYSPGSALTLINVLPGDTQGTAGASLGATAGAVSSDGSRTYWSEGGNLYLNRAGAGSIEVAAGAQFQTASADGSVAFYTSGGHLYRYRVAGGSSTDLTPGETVEGVLGASENGAYVYYQSSTGLFLNHEGTKQAVAATAGASNFPPSTGTARVSPSGTRLLFVSTAQLTGYDNTDLNTGLPDSQVFLYEVEGNRLNCASCNPTNERPSGASTIPGAVANGARADAVDAYKPRVLSANGRRVVFDSADALGLGDTDNAKDVYEWEVSGEGSCQKGGGCVALLSSGRSLGGASLVDSSSDGADVFFVTDASLVATDPGAVDLYDARVGGGFPIPQEPLPCKGDACQPLPPSPVDPTLTTLLNGPGNPGVRYPGKKECKKGFHRHRGKCVKDNGKKGKSAKGKQAKGKTKQGKKEGGQGK